MSAVAVAPTNRPDDTAFKQQRLKAWQPILTPLWVIMTFTIIGIIFIPIGIVLKSEADGIYEQVIVYDSTRPDVNCTISQNNQGYNAIAADTPMSCSLSFTFTQAVPYNSPVNVYYQLTNFYQNHRRYVKSFDSTQLLGGYVSASALSTACDPNASYVSSENGLIYAPCGLIATSFFNDAFVFTSYNNIASGSGTPVYVNETGIAWTSDLENLYRNPTNPSGGPDVLNNWNTYQYLWQTYDQMSCYSGSTRTACYTWANVTGIPTAFGNGCAKCPPGSTAVYQGGIPPPGGPENFDPTPGIPGDALSSYGFRDEHFIVWMRTAGLPQFRKLYGVLKPPVGGFQKGDTVVFDVVTNFEVASFGGTKALVLSTSAPTGGRSDVLGVAYIVVGTICLGLALAFLTKHLVAPRKLGDPQYIVWRHAK
jgi:hypothetical protein